MRLVSMRSVFLTLIAGVAGTLFAAGCAGVRPAAPRSQSVERSGLELVVSFEKRAYSTSEPIPVRFTLRNAGVAPAWVSRRFYLGAESLPKESRDVVLHITAPSGAQAPCLFSFKTGLPKSDDFQRLEPGQEAVSEHPRDLRGFFTFTEAGTYTVVAVYQNVHGAEIGLNAFTGRLVSEPATFTLTQ